jgi:hypothetical protein
MKRLRDLFERDKSGRPGSPATGWKPNIYFYYNQPFFAS